ncbi:MAG: NAD(P)-dependent oxidoreductase [Planctomycetota bacterium]|jgi:D-3-phosphoglycerate dehydrogenase
MWTVVVSEALSDKAVAYLAEHATVVRCGPEDVGEHIADADALVVRTYTQVTEDLLAKAGKLKVVGRAGVALENIDVSACRARGIEVVHAPAANTLAVVDYTIRQIIEMNRRFWPMTRPMTADEFHAARKQIFGRFLADATLGVIGAGRIGSRVGRVAAAMGMTVLYNDIVPIELDYPAREVDKPTLYAESDIVTIHVPLTEKTHGLIDAAALAQFKDGAQLINSARGPCIVPADVAAAVRSGKLSAVAVDCHDPEPPPADYPLLGLDNVILTPHIAARVPAAMEAMSDVVHDIVAVLEGKPPEYPADL